MNSKWWLGYLAFYIIFNIWALTQLPELHSFNITDALYLIMASGVIGLALGKKIISLFLWKLIFWISVPLIIHAWVVLPFIYFTEGIPWPNIGVIQLFSVPSLPLFIGVIVYVWRSPEIWSGSA